MKALALRAMSGVFNSVLVSEVLYGTTLLSRKSRRAPVFMAKLIFSGMLPVALDEFQGIQFCGDHADHFTTGGQQRSATVAGLNGRADLQEARIVQNAAERA